MPRIAILASLVAATIESPAKIAARVELRWATIHAVIPPMSAPGPDLDDEAPSTPTNVVETSHTSAGAALAWDASTDNVGVTAYSVLRAGVEVALVEGLSFTDTGLMPSTAYVYTVKARDAAGNTSAASSSVTITTDAGVDTTAPSAPSTLTSPSHTDASAVLSWGASTDDVAVIGYVVFRDGLNVGTTAGTTFTDSGLTASTAYTYTVKAVDAAGNVSVASNSAVVTTSAPADTLAPTAPTGVHGTGQTSSSASLAWGAATDDTAVTGYRIIRDGINIGLVDGATLTFTDTGLLPSHAYRYTVKAKDAAGHFSVASNGVTITTDVAVDATPPSAPTSLTATAHTSSSASLSWGASTDNVGVTGYVVFRSGVQVGTTVAGTLTFDDTGLDAGVAYTYTVKARDLAGNVSASSNALIVTTDAGRFVPVAASLWREVYVNQGDFGFNEYDESTQVLRGTVTTKRACAGSTVRDIASVTTATPPVVTLKQAHGRSNGDPVLLDGIKKNTGTGAAPITSQTVVYAKVLTTTTLSLYTDAGLTTPFALTVDLKANAGYLGLAYVSTWRQIITSSPGTYTDGLEGTHGPVFTLDGDGFYRLENVETNYLSLSGTDSAHRLKSRGRNVCIRNTNFDLSDPQNLDPYTGHFDRNFVELDWEDWCIRGGTGGQLGYSDPLSGQRLTKGGAVAEEGTSGSDRYFYVEAAVYDLWKVNGDAVKGGTTDRWWESGTCTRHPGLGGGGHTDNFQVTWLDNRNLTRPTWKKVIVQSGGNGCFFLNEFAGTTGSTIVNAVAEDCISLGGNKMFDLSACRLSGGQNCYAPRGTTPVDLGNGTDTGNGTHPYPRIPIAFHVYQENATTPGAWDLANYLANPGPGSGAGYGPDGAAAPDIEYDYAYFD